MVWGQFWVCTILQGASWILILVAHPETKYERPGTAGLSTGDVAKDTKPTKPTKPTGTARTTYVSGLIAAVSSSNMTSSSERPVGRPSKSQFSLIPRPLFYHGVSNIIRDVLCPLQIMFLFPIVFWASCAMGFAANSLLALNLTEAQ